MLWRSKITNTIWRIKTQRASGLFCFSTPLVFLGFLFFKVLLEVSLLKDETISYQLKRSSAFKEGMTVVINAGYNLTAPTEIIAHTGWIRKSPQDRACCWIKYFFPLSLCFIDISGKRV